MKDSAELWSDDKPRAFSSQPRKNGFTAEVLSQSGQQQHSLNTRFTRICCEPHVPATNVIQSWMSRDSWHGEADRLVR